MCMFHGKIPITLYWCGYELVHKNPVGYEATIKMLDTPFKAIGWVWRHKKYIPDKRVADEWISPQEFFRRKGGDCEDWALFFNACLRHTEYKGYILCFYTKKTGHAVYLIPKGNKQWESIDTYGYMTHEGQITDFIKDWSGFKDWTQYVLYDENRMIIDHVWNV